MECSARTRRRTPVLIGARNTACSRLSSTCACPRCACALPEGSWTDCPPPRCTTRLQAYEWTRPTPTSLKIIHSRVYAQVRRGAACSRPITFQVALLCAHKHAACTAGVGLQAGLVSLSDAAAAPLACLHVSLPALPCLQAFTLAALGAVGAIEVYAQSTKQAPEKDKHGY